MTEFGKRLDGPGGRRAASREPILLSAALLSMGCSRPIILSDVSRTGAQLRLDEALRCGQEVWIKVSPAEIFGEVIWAEGERCGILFDEPLSDDELGLLQALGSLTAVRNLSPDELLAMEDWGTGLAR
jgi:hypothetical protein